ncbi:MAG TPA: thioredoxin family protein [Thermoanaerobaculia bacterium]|nr:thioredoxin family protein [Thermoanaerobaculia bacterium]
MKTSHQPSRPTFLLATLLTLVASLLPFAAAATPDSATDGAATEAVWHTELDPALAAAAGDDRYLIVDLYAEWCGWCKRMDAQVFSTPSFAEFAADYVLLRVDVEDQGEGTWLQYRLGANSLPTLAVLAPDMALVGLVQGFRPEAILLSAIESHVAGYETKRAGLDAAVAGGTLQERLEAAERLRQMQAGAAAADAFRKVAGDDSWSLVERLRIAVATADSLRLARRYADADAELERARRLLAAGQLDDDARDDTAGLLDIAALTLAEELEDCQKLAALEDFVHDRTASPLIGQARDRLDHLKSEDFGCS